ncbi:MAG: hypothetical protein WC246_01800 [Candidatus Paceibacterota bacterium]|jgi:DNA polymerase-3 subunit delta'
MIYGYDDIVQDLKRLADTRALAHAYLFFGEAGVGKYACAHALARYCETGVWDQDGALLQEVFILDAHELLERDDANKESIGIQSVRGLERFLYQTPIRSPYRIGIVRDAEWLTDQAQNALLKLLEEPPARGMVILIAQDPSVLLPTVSSRVQGICMGIVGDNRVLDFLKEYAKIAPSNAQKIAKKARGRIGRAKSLLAPDKSRETAQKLVSMCLKRPASAYALKKIADDVVDFMEKKPAHMNLFFEELLDALPVDPAHVSVRRAISDGIAAIATYGAHKRLILKKILWVKHSLTSFSSS